MSEFMVLKNSYDPDNLSGSWQSAGFANTCQRAVIKALRPKIEFERGDMFVIIPIEHASDIIEHIQWTGIAASHQSVVKAPRPLNGALSNWYIIYSAFTEKALFDLMHGHLSLRSKILLAYQWITHIVMPHVAEDVEIYQGIHQLERWLEGTHDRMDFATARIRLENKTTRLSERPLHYAQHALLNTMQLVKYGDDFWKIINCIEEFIIHAYPSNAAYWHEKRTEQRLGMKAILTRLFPLHEVLLAMIENKKIDLQLTDAAR